MTGRFVDVPADLTRSRSATRDAWSPPSPGLGRETATIDPAHVVATDKTGEADEALEQLTHLAGASAGTPAHPKQPPGWTAMHATPAEPRAVPRLDPRDREIAARNASGARLCIRAAAFDSRDTVEQFDCDTRGGSRRSPPSRPAGSSPRHARSRSSARAAPARPRELTRLRRCRPIIVDEHGPRPSSRMPRPRRGRGHGHPPPVGPRHTLPSIRTEDTANSARDPVAAFLERRIGLTPRRQLLPAALSAVPAEHARISAGRSLVCRTARLVAVPPVTLTRSGRRTSVVSARSPRSAT